MSNQNSDYKIYPYKQTGDSSKVVYENITYTGIVKKVFLNYNKSDNPNQYPPGTIEVESVRFSGIRTAFPYEVSISTLPVENEVVEVFIKSDLHYYRRKGYAGNVNNSIYHNQSSGAGSKPFPNTELGGYNSGFGGTNATSAGPNTGNKKFKKIVNPLEYYSGDTVIQSRFGQSIRLSGYNNEFEEEHPSIIIRNRISSTNKNKLGETITEDVNKDGSTIAITSGKYTSKFIPGLIDKNGKSNFKLQPWNGSPKYALEAYPKKLTGDQIIITSGRLIFSSKSDETLFFSKGNFGITTDDLFSIDSMNGINIVSHKGNIDIEAKEKIIILDVGKKGTIYLGRGEGGKKLYPALRGKPIIELLGKLLDTMENLANMGILTPAGPCSGNTPITMQEIDKYRRDLPNMLSKTVWIEE